MRFVRAIMIVAATALAFSARGVLAAQEPAAAHPKPVGRLVGVYDERTGNPIDSAEVRDIATNMFALTTSTGTLSLFFIDSAGAVVRIRKLGYEPVTMFVANAPSDPPLTITLVPIGQVLPKVVTLDSAPSYTSTALKGFEERRRSGIGRFIPEAIIRKEEDRTLGNIIKARVPGLDVRQMRNGSRWVTVAVTTRDGKPCPVDVYLDGIPVSAAATVAATSAIPGQVGRGAGARGEAASLANDLGDFLPKNLAGIEYYNTATVPAQFNRTASGCGTLLLWSRER